MNNWITSDFILLLVTEADKRCSACKCGHCFAYSQDRTDTTDWLTYMLPCASLWRPMTLARHCLERVVDLSQHIGLCSVLRPRQHSRPIGYMEDGLVAKDTSTVAKCSNNQLSSVWRLHQIRFLQVKRPNQQYQSSEGTHTRGWLP